MSVRAVAVIPVVLLLVAATRAQAQTVNRLAVGVDFSLRDIAHPGATGKLGPGFDWRIGHSSQGWGWKYGLNWFSTTLDRQIGAGEVPLGKLSVRPIMAGYGYTRVIRNMSVSASLLGGYAFSQFSLEPGATDAYRERLGATAVRAEATNTFVVKPEISGWIDMSRRIGIHTGISYLVARPEVVVTSSLGQERQRLRADAFRVKIGVVYSIF